MEMVWPTAAAAAAAAMVGKEKASLPARREGEGGKEGGCRLGKVQRLRFALNTANERRRRTVSRAPSLAPSLARPCLPSSFVLLCGATRGGGGGGGNQAAEGNAADGRTDGRTDA